MRMLLDKRINEAPAEHFYLTMLLNFFVVVN